MVIYYTHMHRRTTIIPCQFVDPTRDVTHVWIWIPSLHDSLF